MPEMHSAENPAASRTSPPLAADGDALDRALTALPRAGLPEGFVPRTSDRIRAEARAGRLRPPVAAPAGRLRPLLRMGFVRRLAGRAVLPDLSRYMDLVLAGCLSLMLASSLALAAWLLRMADPLWSAELAASLRPSGQELLLMLRLPGGLGYLALLCLISLVAAMALTDQRSARLP